MVDNLKTARHCAPDTCPVVVQNYLQLLSLLLVTIYYPTSSCAKTYRKGRSDPCHHWNTIRTCLPLNLAAYLPEFSELFERANLPKAELSTILKNKCLNFSTLFSVVAIGPEKVPYKVAHCHIVSLRHHMKYYERGLPVLGFIVK